MALTNLSQITTSGISTLADVSLNSITGVDATFTGSVSIGGTLTYDDVTNIDSVGLITARSGIRVLTGTATTALVVEGNARVTGILTVGSSSLTLDGTNNVVNVGTALTLGHTQGLQFHTQNLHSQGFDVNNVNVTGIVTATTFIGNLTGTASNASGATGDFSIADKIVHTGDTNTAIRFPAADTVTVETAGSEAARFTTSAISFKAPDGGSRYLFGEMGNSASAELSLYNSSDAQKVRIAANNATFFNGGNVGIGTNAPLSALHVKGPAGEVSARFTDAVNATVFVSHPSSGKSKIADAGGNYGLEFDTASVNVLSGGSERLRITNAGNLGIGHARSAYPIDLQSTTSPLTLNLKLNKTSTTNDYGEIAFQLWSDAGTGANTFGGSGTSRPSVVLRAINENGNTAAGSFVVATWPGGSDNTNLLERFRITSGGVKQIKNGNLNIQSTYIDFSGSISTPSTAAAIYRPADNTLAFSTANTERLRILSNGNITIGTASNPGAKLFFQSSSGSAQCIASGGTNNQDLIIGQSSTERLRIAADGKIAIGGNYANTSSFGRTVLIDGTLGLNNDSGTTGMGFSRGASNATYGYIGTGAFAVTGLDNDDFGISSGATGDLVFATGASGFSAKVRITNAGNVGINDAAPSEKLNVGGNIMLEGENQFMYLCNQGTGNAGIYVRGYCTGSTSNHFLRSHSTNMFTWEVTGSEKMRLHSSGVLTIPNQCGFHIVHDGNGQPNSNSLITNWDTDASHSKSYIKNCSFNGSRFVAPVSGLYFFTAQLLLSGVAANDDGIHLFWTKGSGNSNFTYWNTRHDGSAANGSYGYGTYLPVTGSTTVYLTQNEFFGIGIAYTGDIDIYGTDSNWGHWSGYLVG